MNVYWSIWNSPQQSGEDVIFSDLNYYDPENVFKKEMKLNKSKFDDIPRHNNYLMCPAFSGLLNNVYSIKWPFDYELIYERNNIRSHTYDQKFFDKFVNVRDVNKKFISIKLNYLFFSEKSLEILSSAPYFCNNEFNRFNRVIPGKYDIGNWIRPIEIPIMSDAETNNIVMKKGDESLYITFLTNEKVNLKRFHLTEKIRYFIDNNLMIINYGKSIYKLEYLYKKFQMSKQKKLLISEIKNNLME